MTARNRLFARLSLCLGLCLVVAGCTRPITMESAWQAGARPPEGYRTVLLVAVSEDFDRRRLFENALQRELAAGGTVATPSTRTMRTTDVLDPDSVGALVRTTGAEAVLVTRLVNQKVGVAEKAAREAVAADVPQGDLRDPGQYAVNIYRYDFSVTEEPAALLLNREVTMTTDLFEAGQGNKLYTILSKIKFSSSERLDQNTDVAVIDKVAADLARQLRRDRAVR
jgi:hypothetical protein